MLYTKQLSSGSLNKFGRLGKTAGFFLAVCLIILNIFLTLPQPAIADELGEHILASILKGEEASDAALLLMTRDLGWYQENMHLLKPAIQSRVQQVRFNLAGDAARRAAGRMKEAESIFAATGSWNPGRDMDILYMGKNGDAAAGYIDESYDIITRSMLVNSKDDSILKKFSGEIPKKLSAAKDLRVCTTELPDYGYDGLNKAYKKAQSILSRGGSQEEVLKVFKDEIKNAMSSNLKAHFAASLNPDYYAGASGQEWFRKTYIENPKKMRLFEQTAGGETILREGGVNALPEGMSERLGFGAFGRSGEISEIKFSKIASDYSLFFAHAEGGASENAKYVLRVWSDMGLNAIQDLSDEELKLLAAAKAVDNAVKNGEPDKVSEILRKCGADNSEVFNKKLAKVMYQWTEKRLVKDMEKLVSELGSSSAKTVNELDKMLREAKVSFNLNELVAGLDKLKTAPKEVREDLIKMLKKKFGSTESGKAVIGYVMRNLGLLGDTSGELTRRLAVMLFNMGRITKEEAAAVLLGDELSDAVKLKVNTAKKEIIAISAGSMVEFGDDIDWDALMEEWRKNQVSALIQSPDDDMKKIIAEMKSEPESKLKELGWTDEELAIQNKIKNNLNKNNMNKLGEKLNSRLSKAGGTLKQLQSKVRGLMFNPSYTKLGDASSSVGVFDGVIGAATALFLTYDILYNERLSPEDEALKLENAWVTAIPIVGDFAQGLISGGDAYYEGDKGKALEAGLWITIGVMGCVPGGQLPAVVTGIMLATKPLVSGAYDAKQAQNLIQAWVESGEWTDAKPRELKSLTDRIGKIHELKYEDLLTTSGNVSYKSERFGNTTINNSIRDYAEKNIMPGYPAIKNLRDALKSVYPDFNDKEWDDEFLVGIKIDARGGKGSKILFKSYNMIRTKALVQTIGHLKKWAEDEMRAAKDYDAETARLKGELSALEQELKVYNLVKDADASVEAYTKIIKNVWEQESLPLSKLRIYEHYVKVYKEIAGKLRRVSDLFKEVSADYIPQNWHLTGYPEFDAERINKLASSMESGRKGVFEHIAAVLKEMGLETRVDLKDECHKKAFDIMAPLRYKVSFIENLILYYKQLSQGSSGWYDAYEIAKKKYENARANIYTIPNIQIMAAMETKAMQDAFMTFVFALPYTLATNEAALYNSTAGDYEIRLIGAKNDYELSNGRFGKGGKALETCLLARLKVEMQLSNKDPKLDDEVSARANLVQGKTHKDVVWNWVLEGALKKKRISANEIEFAVEGPGKVTARLHDWWNPATGKYGKVLAEDMVEINPGEAKGTIRITGSSEIDLGSPASYTAQPVLDPKFAQKGGMNTGVEWLLNGKSSNTGNRLSFSPTGEGAYSIQAVLVNQLKNRKEIIASSNTIILNVRDKKKEDDFGKGKDGKTEGMKQPPTCSYEYGEWGECSRATKKQTRSVTATKPEGCVEKQKPVLEQGCTPPPSEEDKRNSYLNCLCRCYCGWAGHIGVWYDPEGKSIPESPSTGPCFGGAGAFGNTSRHHFGAPNDCAKSCWEGVYGKGTYDPANADKIRKDENKKHAKPLVVKMKPSKNPADFGDIIDLTAETTEGTGGYKWSWGGCAQDAKDNTAKVVNTRTCTSCAATVTATDQDGNTASDSVTIKCNAMKVKLTQESPKDNKLPIGSKATFLAEVFSGDKLANGTFYYIWERNPDVTFGDDPKNPRYETKESAQSRNTAKFGKVGTIPVWVNVLKEIEGRKATIGESEQIQIEVSNPKLSLTVDKKTPLIGETVTITVKEEPAMSDDIISFWWEIKGAATNPGPVPNIPNSRAYSFKPKDVKPVIVTLHGKAKDGGNDLGSVDATITAQAYQVSISEPKYLESPPEIWQCDTQLGHAQSCGMVKVKPNQFTVGRDVFMKATITPQPEAPRFKWTIDPAGSCGLPGISSEIKLNCSNTGTYNAKVEVSNSDNAKLGEAAQSVTISISQEQLNGSKKGKEAHEKVQKAKELVAQGKLDEAISLADEAAKLDDKNAEVQTLSSKWKKEKDLVNKYIADIKKNITEKKLADAEKNLKEAQKLHPKYLPVVNAEKQLKDAKDAAGKDILARLAAAKEMVAKGQLDEAIKLTEGTTKADPQNAEAKKLFEQWKADKESIILHLSNMRKFILANKIDEAEKELAEPKKLHPKYPPVIEAEKILKDGKDKQANKDGADKLWNEGTVLYNQKKMNEALAKFKESLKYQSTSERVKYIQDLEAGLIKDKANKDASDKLWNEGAALYNQKKMSDALAKFKESIRYQSTPERAKYIQDLERGLVSRDKTIKDASDKLWNEGTALYNQKKINEALAKFKESLKYVPTAERNAYVKDLETKMGQIKDRCRQLNDEGARFQAGGRLKEALVKFTDYQKLCPSPEMESHIKQVQMKVRETEEKEGKKAQAKRLRDEAYTLQQQNHLKEAVAKYRESLAYLYDPELEKYVKQVEMKASATVPVTPPVQQVPMPQPPVGGRAYTSRPMDNSSPLQKSVVIIETGNIGGVQNNPNCSPVFSITVPHRITLIRNYHWNYGKGAPGGTIGLKRQDGTVYGPWQASTGSGQGGAQNINWTASPNIILPAGTYMVIDSDTATWSQNSQSKGCGFTRVEGFAN
jgi:hypothetical protein